MNRQGDWSKFRPKATVIPGTHTPVMDTAAIVQGPQGAPSAFEGGVVGDGERFPSMGVSIHIQVVGVPARLGLARHVGGY
jgi:hypothetical protein